MHEMYDDLEELCGYVETELQKTNDKLRKSGGELTAGDVEYIDKLTHSIKSMKTTMAMLGGASYDDGMSYDENRGNRSGRGISRVAYDSRRRDDMGRYMPDRGYSMDDDELVEELRDVMNSSRDENTKRELKKFINKMESM